MARILQQTTVHQRNQCHQLNSRLTIRASHTLGCILVLSLNYSTSVIKKLLISNLLRYYANILKRSLSTSQELSETAYIRQREHGLDPESVSGFGLRIRVTDKI